MRCRSPAPPRIDDDGLFAEFVGDVFRCGPVLHPKEDIGHIRQYGVMLAVCKQLLRLGEELKVKLYPNAVGAIAVERLLNGIQPRQGGGLVENHVNLVLFLNPSLDDLRHHRGHEHP